jgi:hypothetical protein
MESVDSISFYLILGVIVLLIGAFLGEMLVLATHRKEAAICTDGHTWRFDEAGDLRCSKCNNKASDIIMKDKGKDNEDR